MLLSTHEVGYNDVSKSMIMSELRKAFLCEKENNLISALQKIKSKKKPSIDGFKKLCVATISNCNAGDGAPRVHFFSNLRDVARKA